MYIKSILYVRILLCENIIYKEYFISRTKQKDVSAYVDTSPLWLCNILDYFFRSGISPRLITYGLV